MWLKCKKLGKLNLGILREGVGKKKFTPIFSPVGGPGAPKLLHLRGLVGLYLSSKHDVHMMKNAVRGRLLPVSKNFLEVNSESGGVYSHA